MKKVLSVLVGLSLLLMILAGCADAQPAPSTEPVAAPSVAASAPQAAQTDDIPLVILHTNDTHGRLEAFEGYTLGIAAAAQMKADYEAAGADVILLDAGDTIQGTTLANHDQGATVVELMNAAGYNAMTAGNHEFDFGLEQLMALQESMAFPLLGSNATRKDTGEALFSGGTVIHTASGRAVGVFGLCSPETKTASHPDKVKDIAFNEDELYDIAQKEIDALLAAGCETIICLGHLGDADSSAPYRSIDVIENTTGIDLFIDGHSHTLHENGRQLGGTLLASAGELSSYVGVVEFAGNTPSAKVVSAAEYTGPSQETAALLQEKLAALDAEYSMPFAESAVELPLVNADGSNMINAETALGNLIADSLLYGAKEATGLEIDAALTNGGGIRAPLAPGSLTKNDMLSVLPFGNEIAVIKVTGAQLLEALEAACFSTPGEAGAFPQVAGLTFRIDTSVPYENGEAYGESTFYAPAKPGARVQDVMVGGQPLETDKTYTIATNDFMAAGGDTYAVFKQAESQGSGKLLVEALMDYITNELGGVVAAEYAATEGRITVE